MLMNIEMLQKKKMKRHVKGTENKDQEEPTLLLAYKGES